MRPLPILLTRPEAQARALAVRLAEAGAGRIVISPLLRIVPVGRLPPAPEAVLLTSANAVAVWRELGGPRGLPAWVVGYGTADLARAAGFELRGVAEDADGLARLVPDDAPPLVHLRGRVQRGDLPARLRGRGLSATDAVIYDQVARPLTAEARQAILGGAVLAPLYSPRTAALLAEMCPPGGLANLRPIALSEAVAQALPVPPVATADRPDGASMMRAILANLRLSAVEGGGGTV
ncbi:uroporphyrinogen-III synthase [Jannaschia sp. S6380]|uniref:uroporphyrinogen-III synthase n=1 Tax=Jannaschia sp. S6380 TaxID=2926408 RepID=UPI001FF28B43|nr:uroporphyrinogen-III synthase [Jannaschia sp. S6380]MCK0169023.1 uroporphyrinogen-III synthase [Jannaschia sp. S6380]